jgi:hypothetical protein
MMNAFKNWVKHWTPENSRALQDINSDNSSPDRSQPKLSHNKRKRALARELLSESKTKQAQHRRAESSAQQNQEKPT